MKLTIGGKGGKVLSLKEINDQINELLKASIQSEGVISLFDSKTVGEKFSLFDPNVLEEISKMKEKNIVRDAAQADDRTGGNLQEDKCGAVAEVL